MKYRPDIDGLRSVAVIAVLFFHAGFSFFRGGFVGVDVFFVISGYLITRIIHDEVIATGSFSFSNFYIRRTRRLFPALFFTLILSSIFAFILFSPHYLERFGGSLIHAITSVSNFFFWGESGYFDADASFKPLLHTWSLCVEEQFYLGWPVVFVFLLLKAPKFAAPVAVVLGGVLSLYLNQVFADGNVEMLNELSPVAAGWFADGTATIFFLTPFRVFEFSIGALLVWLVRFQPKNRLVLEPLAALGLIMIAYPVFTYTKHIVFPSYNALMPCIGTALLIYAGTARYTGRLLNNRAAVGIGRISYSLYLIHWPIVVFYKYYKFDQYLSIREQLVICAASVIAAGFMYQFVEQPFRHRVKSSKTLSPAGFGFTCSMLALLLILPAANIWANNGWEWRFDDNAVFISLDEVRAAEDRRYEFLEKGCRIGSMENCDKNADLQILTFGNSHELDAYNILVSQYGQRDDINITSFGTSFGCGFKLEGGRVINTKQNSKLQCSLRAGLLNDKDFINTLDIIAYSVHQPLAVQDTMTILRHLKTINPRMKIIFFSGYIGIRPYRCDALINRYGDVDTCKDPKFVNYFAGGDEKKMILAMTFAKTDFLYIDKVDLFCEGRLLENCLMQANRTPAFYDGDHLSVEFARLLSDKMTAAYADELAKFGL